MIGNSMSHPLGLTCKVLDEPLARGLIVLRLAPPSGGDLPNLPDGLCSRTRLRHSSTVGGSP